MIQEFDLIVIGGGPGGYVAAIKAAKLGMKTALIECREVGGTCLNRGCIPAKAMIHASSLYRQMKESEAFGILASNIEVDYAKVISYKEATISKLVQGVAQLLKANGVVYFHGTGSLCQDHIVHVVSDDIQEELYGKDIILATGSKPSLPPIPGISLPHVVTSDELFQLDHIPESLIIIGGGVIGMEFASVFSALGCKVTILEALPRILANLDKEISQNLKLIMKKRGVDIHTSALVQSIAQEGDTCTCTYLEKEKAMMVSGEYVLCAVGRVPNTDQLLKQVSLKMERGRIVVDEHFQTSESHVYAIGDVIEGIQLAHVASAQGEYVVEQIAQKTPSIDLHVIPSCVYTEPEIASVGLREEEAIVQGIAIETGKFMMSANGKSLITQEERGFIKIIIQKETREVLGAQMMCARATDMIGEFVTAIANHMNVDQLLRGMRAHPTYNEGIKEALEELDGRAIHVIPRRKR